MIVLCSRWTIVNHHDSLSNRSFYQPFHFIIVYISLQSTLWWRHYWSSINTKFQFQNVEIRNRYAKTNTFEANYVTNHPLFFHMVRVARCQCCHLNQDNLRLSIRCGFSHVANVTSQPPKCARCWSSSVCFRHNETQVLNILCCVCYIPSNRTEFVLCCFAPFFSCFSELTEFIFFEFGWFV